MSTAIPEVSSVDAIIIAHLQKNARVTNKELAAAAGVAESTCFERVRSLRERGVIRGYHAEVDLGAIGRGIRALISVRLQPKTAESVRAFEAAVTSAPETLNVWMVSGADDFLVEAAVPDVEHLRHFVLEVIASRSDVVDTRSSLVYEHRRNDVVGTLAKRA